MSDTQPTQPLPGPAAQWVLSTSTPPPPPKKRRWPWLVALVAVIALVVAAWFAGEYIARGIVEKAVRDQLITQLSLPADQPIDLVIEGAVLPQLIVGSFGHVEIASDDVPLNGLTADVRVELDDVPIRGGGDWSGGYATVTFDEAQLRALLGDIEGFPAETVTIDAPDLAVEFELQLFALTIPVGVAMTPRAEAGELVLTPASLRLAGAEISADALLRQFGAIASTVVRDWDVCIADQLPEALTLTGVQVQSDAVVAELEIDSSILHDPAARQRGSCA